MDAKVIKKKEKAKDFGLSFQNCMGMTSLNVTLRPML
jgi:hypothetical protein